MICGDAMVQFPQQIQLSLSKMADTDLDKVLSLSPSVLERRQLLERKLEDLEKGLAILEDLH